MSAIKKQVGGTHYNKLHIQPIQLGYMLNASPCFVKLAKYITRNKNDKMENLDKAIHVIELEKELIQGDECYFMFMNHELGEAEEVLYDYAASKINLFANQFDNFDLIRDALEYMFLGNYEQAIKMVKFLKERNA